MCQSDLLKTDILRPAHVEQSRNLSHSRHVDSRSLRERGFDTNQPRNLTMNVRPSQEALARFAAKTAIEVATLGTAWSNAHTESIVAADHSIEEFLPLHILIVAARQCGKVAQHEFGQFTSICQSKILPQMVWPCGSAGYEKGQQ